MCIRDSFVVCVDFRFAVFAVTPMQTERVLDVMGTTAVELLVAATTSPSTTTVAAVCSPEVAAQFSAIDSPAVTTGAPRTGASGRPFGSHVRGDQRLTPLGSTPRMRAQTNSPVWSAAVNEEAGSAGVSTVSYTHLTLPTICSV